MSTNRSSTAGASQAGMQEVDRNETYSLIASDKVEGTDVRRSNGDKIGVIDRLMIDKRSGRVAYAVMSFGGFLGLGESRRPVPWESLKYNEDLDAYELNIDENHLRAAPAYNDSDDFDWSDAEWNRNMRQHYAVPGTGYTM
jgi:hypothetical protein